MVKIWSGGKLSVAPSFIDFLMLHLQRVETGVYQMSTPAEEGGPTQINRFAAADPLGSDQTTNGVRIRVSVIHVPEQSKWQQQILFDPRLPTDM